MGVEWPRPGILVFHLMFCVSLHVSGGFAPAAVPVPDVPRHAGQSDTVSANAMEAKRGSETPRQRRTDFIVRIKGWGDCGGERRTASCRRCGVDRQGQRRATG